MKKINEKGFTLVEILIAIAIFAIGILAIGKMQLSAITGNYFANDMTKAVTFAQDRIEKLISLPYNDDPLNEVHIDGDAGLDANTTATADHSELNVGGRYDIFWNIAPDHYLKNTKTIRVIVRWSDKGTQKAIALTSMKADII
jgi:prepilin-type N-terminal cleavage/methylation domain-containing protein